MTYSPKIILTPFGRHDSNLADKEADVEADRQVKSMAGRNGYLGTCCHRLHDYHQEQEQLLKLMEIIMTFLKRKIKENTYGHPDVK